MTRGTTPLHVFKLPSNLVGLTIEALYITYKQCGAVRLEKTLDDVEIADDGSISVQLTQAETLAFSSNLQQGSVQIQMRIRLADGNALASNIIKVPVETVLKEGEI